MSAKWFQNFNIWHGYVLFCLSAELVMYQMALRWTRHPLMWKFKKKDMLVKHIFILL